MKKLSELEWERLPCVSRLRGCGTDVSRLALRASCYLLQAGVWPGYALPPAMRCAAPLLCEYSEYPWVSTRSTCEYSEYPWVSSTPCDALRCSPYSMPSLHFLTPFPRSPHSIAHCLACRCLTPAPPVHTQRHTRTHARMHKHTHTHTHTNTNTCAHARTQQHARADAQVTGPAELVAAARRSGRMPTPVWPQG